MANDRERTVGEVLTAIVGNVQRIAAGEASVALARVVDRATRTTTAAGLLAAGASLASLLLGLLVVAAIAYLSGRFPLWQAVLIVAVPIGAAAGITIGLGVRALNRSAATPADTISHQGVNHGTAIEHGRQPPPPGAGRTGEERFGTRDQSEGRRQLA